MGNCLVTKLKGSVDNDNLFKLGESILCSVKAGTLGGLALFNSLSNHVSVRTANGGVFCNAEGTPLGVTSINLPEGVQTDVIIRAAAGDDAPIIINDPTYATPIIWNIDSNDSIQPSNLTGDMTPYFTYRPLINPSGNSRDRYKNSLYLNIDNIQVSPTIVYFSGLRAINKIEGNIENLIKETLIYCTIIYFPNNKGVYGNITNIMQYLPSLTTLSLYDTSITCNIEELAQVLPTTVKTLFIGLGTTLSGSVEAFCETMLSRYGGVSHNLTFGVGGTAVTLHGVAITDTLDFKVEFGSGSITIKYNISGDTIATYNGSTWTYA